MTRIDKATLLGAIGGAGLWWFTRHSTASEYSFKDKVVFITGGSRGLGLVMARELAREGARVAICARDGDELQRASAEVTASHAFVADVTDRAQTADAIANAEAECGPIDVLINNAGTIVVGPMATMTREDFEASLAVTFWGAYNTIDAVLPRMRARKAGRIVNISSIGGKVSVPHLLPYSVGKFALAGYSQGLRAELASEGIVVTTVYPGLMRTGSPRNGFFKGNHNAEYGWFKVSDSLPMITVSAEDAAKQIIESCRRGDAELVISAPAKASVWLSNTFPEFFAKLLSMANYLLPAANGGGTQATPGKHCETSRFLAPLTALTDEAALQNNEVDPSDKTRTNFVLSNE